MDGAAITMWIAPTALAIPQWFALNPGASNLDEDAMHFIV